MRHLGDDLNIGQAFDASPNAYVVLTPDLRIAGMNRAYLDVTGRERADLIGRDMFEAFDGGGAAQVAAWLALARETERSESFAAVVRDLAERLARLGGDDPAARDKARRLVLIAAYMAFADALIGPALKTMLDAPADEPRDLALAAARGVIEGA